MRGKVEVDADSSFNVFMQSTSPRNCGPARMAYRRHPGVLPTACGGISSDFARARHKF